MTFHCEICNKVFLYNKDYSLHIKKQPNCKKTILIKKEYKCYNNNYNIRKLPKNNKIKSLNVIQTENICHFCNRIFKVTYHLMKHIETCVLCDNIAQ